MLKKVLGVGTDRQIIRFSSGFRLVIKKRTSDIECWSSGSGLRKQRKSSEMFNVDQPELELEILGGVF